MIDLVVENKTGGEVRHTFYYEHYYGKNKEWRSRYL
jgi:hypothetical protein